MFLLEEADLLELNQFEEVSNEKLAEHFCFFHMVKNFLEMPAVVLECKADGRRCC